MAGRTDKPFVKSADTSTPAGNSRTEIEKVLRRYGAVGLSVAQQYNDAKLPTRIVLEFVIPDSLDAKAGKVPVRLPVDVLRIYDAMYGRPTKQRGVAPETPENPGKYWRYVDEYNPAGYDPKKLAQAERVAWRNLKLWIDAALSAVTANLQTVTEAFLAHTLVADEDGRTSRMMDYLERSQGALGNGARALLPAPKPEG